MKTTINIIANAGDLNFNSSQAIEAGSRVGVQEPVPDGSTDLVVEAFISNDTADRVKFIAMRAELADLTIKLADSTGTKIDASAEYTLAAGAVFVWPQTSGEADPAWLGTGDIEQILVTNNSSGIDGNIVLSALYDPTT